MTWLSRLLPQSPSLQRLAGHNHRTRQSQRRRRMATLETLEGRTLLSNVVVTPTTAPNGSVTLNIVGDTHNDTFTVSENNANGFVTVTGGPQTLINTNARTITTTLAISNIAITLPGNHNSTDSVTITSTGTGVGTLSTVNIVAPGVTTPGVAGLDLTLTVTNLTVAGELSVWDAPTFAPTLAPSPTFPVVPTASGQVTVTNAPTFGTLTSEFPSVPGSYTPPVVLATSPVGATTVNNNLGGILTASVTGSHLGSLYIEQDGCCLANVTVDHDTIAGSLTVEEGVANGDTITLTNSTAGTTTLLQGYGPTMAGCNGSGDLVNVQDDGTATTGLLDLLIAQLGSGSGTILVGTQSEVEVGLAGFGIEATQYDGSGSSSLIHIESITTYAPAHVSSSPFGLLGPPYIVTVQHAGFNDRTTIDNAVIPGNISATQGDGGSDIITLNADSAGYTTTLAGGLLKAYYGHVKLTQGNGGGDLVFLSSTGSEGNALNVFASDLLIVQGNGGGDIVTVDSTDVVTGWIIVVQGNGAFDQVFITSTTAGYTTPGPFGSVKDHGGLLVVIQGNGYEDSINITSLGLESPPDFGSVFNQVLLIQGASTNGDNVVCTQATGDVVSIDETTIYDNLVILQNVNFVVPTGTSLAATLGPVASDPAGTLITDGPGLGVNIVNIGTGTTVNSLGVATGPSQTYVGEETFIYQGGANNTDNLGGAGDASGTDFVTGFLDIFTGLGGGGYVTADNTAVVYGSFFANDYVINGGGDGNTYFDTGGNSINGAPGTLPYNTATYSG